MNKPFTCFILAAGFGKRMRPITDNIPKPLLPIAGRPLLESIINKALAAGCIKIGINIHHLHDHIRTWIDNTGMNAVISLFHEPVILNTGGALKNAESFLDGYDFLVHNGDILSDIDIAELLRQHRLSGDIATLATFDLPAINNVLINGDGSFKAVGTGLRQSAGERLVAFTGIAAYSPSFLRLLPDGASSVLDAWATAVATGFRIGTFDTSGKYWNDIGRPEAYVSAVIRELRENGETVYFDPSASIGEAIGIEGHVILERSASAGKSSCMRNCIVLPGGNAEAGRHYENSIIGPEYAVPVNETAFGLSVADRGLLVGVGGSDRKYFRVRDGNETMVRMECRQDDPDFERHIEYTAFFACNGMPVPELISVDFDNRTAFFEDLGDISLYSWLKCRRSEKEKEQAYRRVLKIAAALHGCVSDYVAECPLLAARVFDYDHLRWETGYFLERYVTGLRGLKIDNPSALDVEFHLLALKADSFTKRIIHRDFQSQNIMMQYDGLPRLIDFQGARMAPPAYDLASILWDPYSPLNDDMRTRLLAFYLELQAGMAVNQFDPAEFADSLRYCRLQRHMQALGAYAFLSETKGRHYFRKHIPEGLRLLEEDIISLREEFPVLAGLIARLNIDLSA
jgi:NDP-sugar pyrophosphorylase family protein/aminoglycoside/choline kinase family phosphotransferase